MYGTISKSIGRMFSLKKWGRKLENRKNKITFNKREELPMEHRLITILLGLILIVLPMYASDSLFTDYREDLVLGRGYRPYSLYSGTIDGDEDIDIVVATSGGMGRDLGIIYVFSNNGDGTFEELKRYRVGDWPISVHLADLNGDETNDILVANLHSANISVLINDGNGEFISTTNYSVGSGPRSVFAADLDGDGDSDVAVANISKSISILLNNGDGTLQSAFEVEIGAIPKSIFAADFDGDGKMDLVTSNYNLPNFDSNNISIFKNKGNGTFYKPINYNVKEMHTGHIIASDLDNDGDQDLAVTCDRKICILLNRGDGKFGKPDYYNVSAFAITSADIDNDGDQDLAVTDYSQRISVFLNNGKGKFTKDGVYAVGSTPNSIVIEDFNSDGNNDIAVANELSGSISVLFNSGEGTFHWTGYGFTTGSITDKVISADLDSDGNNDLILLTNDEAGKVSILLNKGNARFHQPVDYMVGKYPRSVVAADIDGDSDNDLVVANNMSNNLSILLNNGDGSFQSFMTLDAAGLGPKSIFVADLDGDKDNDLAVTTGGSKDLNKVLIFINSGDGSFRSATSIQEGRFGAGDISGADYDGDGVNDLAVVITRSGVSVFLNNGDGTFKNRTFYRVGDGLTSICSTDLDNDGDYDLAVTSLREVTILLNEGDGTFKKSSSYGIENTSSILARDFDKDGNQDLAVLHYKSNKVLLLINKGDGSFQGPINLWIGFMPLSLFSADLDGDGDDDIVSVNKGTKDISILFNHRF